MWNATLNMFDGQKLLNALAARRGSYTATMLAWEKILPNLTRVKQLAGTLKSMNCNIDNNEFAIAAMNVLPSSVEHLHVALDALGNEENLFTFDFVKSLILQEEQGSECVKPSQ